jgi:hypothetical protein
MSILIELERTTTPPARSAYALEYLSIQEGKRGLTRQLHSKSERKKKQLPPPQRGALTIEVKGRMALRLDPARELISDG